MTRISMFLLEATSVLVCFLLSTALLIAEQPKTDPLGPIRFFVGDWAGTAEGQAGKGTVRRTYSLILKDRFIHERNISTYPPQEANKAGEVHEHWSIFSFDRDRKTIVLRQFHQEGFVNQYVMNGADSTDKKLVFDSERFENFDNKWRARETYDLLSPDEFIETFELAAPGKELEIYSQNHFKRMKPE